ncbi:MAG: hypothetical protein JJE35_05925 [Thermoleophilia bacterium]|nr:hypothetical protein [Thermoleophilia bacterium]
MVSLAVPPGSYYAIATVEAQSVNPTPSSVTCRLIDGGGGDSVATTRSQIARSDSEVDNFTLAGGFVVSKGETINLQCSKSVPASGARIPAANVVAIEVGGVTGYPD